MSDTNKLVDHLRHIGLSEKEAKVYLQVLKLKEALPARLATLSGIKRPTVYLALQTLCEYGYVQEIRKNGSLYYHALHPRVLLENAMRKLEVINEAQKNLMDHLPRLFAQDLALVQTPQVWVFKGKEGLIKALHDTLTARSEILLWANPALAQLTLREAYADILEKRLKKKISIRCIFPDETRDGPQKSEIAIYDDKLLILSYTNSLAILIQDKTIAETQRILFERMY